jgi:5'-3' exonuclease
LRDEAGVVAKFGVTLQSVPDYLAVVGDSADGFPGVPGWGEKAAAATLSRYLRLENIPKDWRDWHPSISNARRLCGLLSDSWSDALLFRTLATLRLDAPVFDTVDDLRWTGPRAGFESFCQTMGAPDLFARIMAASNAVGKAQSAPAT